MSQNYDDVWFTCKARIAAELRLKNNDTQSQFLLIWYALFSSVIAVIGLRSKDFLGSHTDLYTTILSIVLLAISMWVSVKDFRGRAIAMRKNHIALKLLIDDLNQNNVTAQQKPKKYSELLVECENHLSYDDKYFRFFAKTSRGMNGLDYISLLFQFLIRWAFILGLYLLPLLIVILNFKKLSQ